MDKSHYVEGHQKSLHHRRRNNNFVYLDKSSSEPDLTEFNPLSSRWRKGPTEFITVDELQFYRRRRPPDPQHIHSNQTSSGFVLYNKSEPYIPFSALKTEYQRQYCTSNADGSLPPQARAQLQRRSTSLKLPPPDCVMSGESEQHAQYHPYTVDEMSQCRRKLAHRVDHDFTAASAADTQPTAAADANAVRVKGNVTLDPLAAGKTNANGTTHAAERCHLRLSGDLSYEPEYRNRYGAFAGPIEKSHSIPQLSNIRFQGEFDGTAEYRDSFREYERYARCAPIMPTNHLRPGGNGYINDSAAVVSASTATMTTATTTADSTQQTGEYAEKFQTPLRAEKAVLARHEDQFSLLPMAGNGSERDGKVADGEVVREVSKPEKGRAKQDHLALNGRMEYHPEYRSTYLNHPRARPITNKPKSSLKLGDQHPSRQQSTPSPQRSRTVPFETSNQHRPNIHHDTSNIDDDDRLPFMCQPELRRARQDLLLRKRLGPKEIVSTDSTVEYGSLGNALVADAPSICPLPTPRSGTPTTSGSRLISATTIRLPDAAARSPGPITFRLTVQNVDDADGRRFQTSTSSSKASPKFGRRSSTVVIKESHRLRNHSRIVEGNRAYTTAADGAAVDRSSPTRRSLQHEHLQQQQLQHLRHHHPSRKAQSQSFVVLREPCKQSKWMKTSWYS